MKLKELCLNPDNPRKISDEDLDCLVEKLKRNEGGLKAMRIAYVVGQDDGRKTVISGNTRVMALKKIYGDEWEVPAEYVQDLSSLSEAERHEFIVNANHSDGKWDFDRIVEQYSKDEIQLCGLEEALGRYAGTIDEIPDDFFERPEERGPHEDEGEEKEQPMVECPYCGHMNPVNRKEEEKKDA